MTKKTIAAPTALFPFDPSVSKGILLGLDRFSMYNKFPGTNLVHILQYEGKNAVLLASKVCLCMSPKRFATLRFRLPKI